MACEHPWRHPYKAPPKIASHQIYKSKCIECGVLSSELPNWD
jgi:hypothetical protein